MDIPVRLTTYYPIASRMEGGVNDRGGHPLHTIEDHRDRGAPYCSLSGDDSIFRYGTKCTIDAFPGLVFSIVDTGCSFSSAQHPACHGQSKLVRAIGKEPIDVCIDGPGSTAVPTFATLTVADDAPGVAWQLLPGASSEDSSDWPLLAAGVVGLAALILGVVGWL